MAPRTDPWSLFPALSAKRWLQKAPRDVQIVRLFKLHEKCRAHVFSVPTSEDEISELKRFGWVFIPEIQFFTTAWISGQKIFLERIPKNLNFSGDFGEGRSPKKSPFRGVHQLAGSLVVFF